jgi:NTP pyrophosphatase (non-canonical NTP hydrolase)
MKSHDWKMNLKQKQYEYMQFETSLLKAAHDMARSKGFWDTPSPDVRKINLIREELGELTSAHRHNKIHGGTVSEEYFREDYAANVKGTVEEELADVCIRVFDFVGSDQKMLDVWEICNKEELERVSDFDELLDQAYNFTDIRPVEEVRRFIRIPTQLHGLVCSMINMAEMFEIDLRRAIEMKMRYNAGREYLHGKTY